MPLPGSKMILLNWRLSSGHFGLLRTLTQQSKKGVIVPVGMIDPDFKGNLDCQSTMDVRKSMSGIKEIS